MDFSLNPVEKSTLLQTARQALKKRGWQPTVEELESGALREPHPCFVTLLTEDRQLRGCIGTLSTSTPLGIAAAKYAQLAAEADPRFNPVLPEEVDSLVIEMSVLGPTRPLPGLHEIEIGRHGLLVENGAHSGVLLAKVADEYRWKPNQFLEQTCLKANLDPEQVENYQVSYFEEISFSEN